MSILQHYLVKESKNLVSKHKIMSLGAAAVIVGAGYWGFGALSGDSSGSRYVLAEAEKRTIVASVSGAGQVSASNQVDITPKVSGDVIYVGIKNGQEVAAGTLIAQLDAGDAQKSIRDAKANLENARLAYEKLTKPAETLELMQAENALAQAKTALEKSYDDGFNTVSDTYIDLPSAMTDLDSVLYGTTVAQNGGQSNVAAYTDMVKAYDDSVLNFKQNAEIKYSAARNAYDKSFVNYRSASRSSDPATVKKLIDETYTTTKTVADAVKSASDLLSFVKDRLSKQNYTTPASLTTHQTTLSSAAPKINSHLLSLLSIKNSMASSEYTISEKIESLADLKNGADEIDVKTSQISVTQKENALLDAEEKLADYYIRAPFAGTIAKLNVKKADSVSSGTAVATIITQEKLAEISLNEVDIGKVKVGQKVTLTFDAVEGLTAVGEVAEVDAVGTVSQGVVSYNIKIKFDANDDRIRPGMSVSASIITDTKQDVLAVPNGAIKSQGNTSYVEVFSGKYSSSEMTAGIISTVVPQKQQVEIGLADDSWTEVILGIEAGQQVVTRTVSSASSSSQTTTQQSPSLFGGGGNVRISR